jgi:flagellar FliJ protein
MSDQAIKFLRKRAQESRDAAGVRLARSRNEDKKVSEQIALLTEYRASYRRRMQQAMLEGTTLQSVRDYQTFLASLDKAIDSARRSQEQYREELAQTTSLMQQQQRELSSFDAVVTRRMNRRAAEDARLAMKDSDAVATQIYTRRLSQPDHFQRTDTDHE